MKFFLTIFLSASFLITQSFSLDGQTLYKKCKGCHGKFGKHPPYEKQNGILAGRDKVEIELIIKAIKEGNYPASKLNNIMKRVISKFDEEDISVLADYISKFKN